MKYTFLSRLVAKVGNSPTPLWGQFELLPVCNLRCPMCYIHNPLNDHRNISEILPASFWINIARQAVDAGMLVLSVTGGETMLYPDLDTLLEELSHMGIIISLNTNGTLIDEKQADRLSKYSLAKINITLYGGSDETYYAVTGHPEGFSKVCRAIKVLQDAGQNVYLNGVLTPDNEDELPEMLKVASSRGLVLHETPYIFPRRESCGEYNPDAVRLSPEDAALAWSRYSKLKNGEMQYKQSSAIAVLRDHSISRRAEPILRTGSCHAGKYEFAVNWRGKLQPCVVLPAIEEDLSEQAFSAAWEKCVTFMRELPFPKKCVACSHLDFCPVCPASVYLETGTHSKAPEYLCRYSDKMLKIWEEDIKDLKVRVKDAKIISMKDEFRGCEG